MKSVVSEKLPKRTSLSVLQNRLLITTDIPVRSETARSAQKIPAGTVNNAHPCTLFTCAIYISQIAFLHGTRGIRAASDTSRTIFSSGMWYITFP